MKPAIKHHSGTAQTKLVNRSLLREVKEIEKAFRYIALVKSGKLKVWPIEDLLNEL